MAGNPRFAFADTTLLRDTLGIKFPRLFELADSLALSPDTLRALSVRYSWSLERLVHLADSLTLATGGDVSVDSVGPRLARERFLPLERGVSSSQLFTYTTNYATDTQTHTRSWNNRVAYEIQMSSLVVLNELAVQSSRYQGQSGTSLARRASSDARWKLSRGTSAGARAAFDGTLSPEAARTKNQTTGFELSFRSNTRATAWLEPTINFIGGFTDESTSGFGKRGIPADLNGRVLLRGGRWLKHELSGQVAGKIGHGNPIGSPIQINTNDLYRNLSGTLRLFPAASSPVQATATYKLRRTRTENPDTIQVAPASIGPNKFDVLPIIRQTREANDSWDGTVRLRQDSDRFLDASRKIGTSTNSSGQRRDRQDNVALRYSMFGLPFDLRFSNNYSTIETPPFYSPDGRLGGGYGQKTIQRSLDGSLARSVGPRLTLRLSGNVSLNSLRSYATAAGAREPTPGDLAGQNYKIETRYNPSPRLGSDLALQVRRQHNVKIRSKDSGANNLVRSYALEWRWNCRLLPGLTVNQNNTLRADYQSPDYQVSNVEVKDRLTIERRFTTTVNAIVTPRLQVQVTQVASRRAGGDYSQFEDGFYYFSQADELADDQLGAAMTYTPIQAFSFSLAPKYVGGSNFSTSDGAKVPNPDRKQLTVSGTAGCTFKLMGKHPVRFDLSRNESFSRQTTYSGGVANPKRKHSPAYWSGNMQISWQL